MIPSGELGRVDGKAGEEGAGWRFFIPIQMKKKSPAGDMLNVLCGKGEEQKFAKILMQDTSTIGVRWNCFDCAVMQREAVTVEFHGRAERGNDAALKESARRPSNIPQKRQPESMAAR